MADIIQLSKDGKNVYLQTHVKAVLGLKEFINELVKIPDIDLRNYMTKEQVDNAISKATKGLSPDMTNYLTKDETVTEITSIVNKVIGESKPDSSSYQTQSDVQSSIRSALTNYLDSDEVKTAITQAISNVKPDFTSYYTKDEIDKKISDYSTTKEMNTAIENATTYTDVYTFNPKSPFSGHGSLIRQGKVVTFQFTGQASDTNKGMDMGSLPAWALPFEKVSFPVQEMDNDYLNKMVGIGTIGTDGVVWAATNNTSGFINFTISYIGS